ncbi:MAG: hypothetical protein IAE82_16050 [Opitutaceae bacterium]|nr:hypothetical protein [Opitutaceae bacterium]
MHPRPITPVLLKITGYYLVAAVALAVLLARAPWMKEYLPVGAVDRLFSPPTGTGLLVGPQAIATGGSRLEGKSLGGSVVFLAICFACSFIAAIPVAEVYKHTSRRKKGPSISSLRMILLLPICVAGIVLIVQNSLALAFSLAGLIAGAGVRFRTQVRQLSDVLFFMVATGIGLASGVGALGIAVVMSMVFCYVSLLVYVREPAPLGKSDDGEEDKGNDDGD